MLISSLDCSIPTGAPLVGAVNHLLHQMYGAPRHCLQMLMVVAVRLAISVLALHLVEVAHDLQPQVVTEHMNLLMPGVQILDHRRLLGHWLQIRHHLYLCVLVVQKQDLVALSYPGLLDPFLKIQGHGVQLGRQKNWYGHAVNEFIVQN